MFHRLPVRALLVLLAAAAASPALAQSNPCRLLCRPTFNVEPTWTIEPLFSRPRISSHDGEVEVESRERFFETVFALDVPTKLPWLGFTFEVITIPFHDTGGNPIEIENEMNFTWLSGEHTGDWVESHFDVVDKFSPAERPGQSGYSHKLNLELDTSLAIFKKLPDSNWFHHVEFEVSLDWVGTGLPRAGDVIDGERFLDNASPWSISLVFVIPVVGGR